MTTNCDRRPAHLPLGLTNWQHPSFFAYFPAACNFESILGELYSSSTCNPGFNVRCSLSPSFKQKPDKNQWTSSPACTELENLVMDWGARLLGLSPGFCNSSEIGGGVMQVLDISCTPSIYTPQHITHIEYRFRLCSSGRGGSSLQIPARTSRSQNRRPGDLHLYSNPLSWCESRRCLRTYRARA